MLYHEGHESCLPTMASITKNSASWKVLLWPHNVRNGFVLSIAQMIPVFQWWLQLLGILLPERCCSGHPMLGTDLFYQLHRWFISNAQNHAIIWRSCLMLVLVHMTKSTKQLQRGQTYGKNTLIRIGHKRLNEFRNMRMLSTKEIWSNWVLVEHV